MLSDNSDNNQQINGKDVINLSDNDHEDDKNSVKSNRSEILISAGSSSNDEDVDEITVVHKMANSHSSLATARPKKARAQKAKVEVIDLDDEDEGDNNDDDDENDMDDAERKAEALIEGLYDDDDEDGPKHRSSATQKRIQGLRQSVVDFFETATPIDLQSISGVSKKKVEYLLALRPVSSWIDLNNKIQNHRSGGINEDIVINAVKTIRSRSVVEKLMNDCQKLAQDIGQLVDKLPEAPQPKCIPTNLKLQPYQLIGLNWLILLHNRGINGILADEMGLGKTIQVIAFLAYLREKLGMNRHHLVIVPSSTLDNWDREFNTWCPDIQLLQYSGSQMERAQIRNFVAKNPDKIDVVLTTYNIAQNPEDRRLFKKIDFEYLIFDEAHMLKNMKSGRYQSLIKIRSRRRVLLTGTPVQNNLVELMSLLVFTMPRMFMSKMTHVEAMFSSASREEGGKTQFERQRIEQAKRIMKPFVMRRVKDEVLKQLPSKSDQVIKCPMSDRQAKLYKQLEDSFKREIKVHSHEVMDDDSSFALDSSDDVKKGAGMLMAMRKLANHPLLMLNLYTKDALRQMSKLMLKEPTHREANENLIFEDMCIMHDFELHKLCETYDSISHFKLKNEDILNSGKFQYLDSLLSKLKDTNQKCLLFSQFTMMLDIIESYMDIRGHGYIRLDGQTKVSDRIGLIDEFNDDQDIFVFLLSTKAGGLGINLTAANVVIIHDIDFNPYNDKQAEDRSHRLGQTKDVLVYKLISENTIEEAMISVANEKLKLGRNISEDGESNAPATKDLRSLLRSTLKL